VPESAIALPPLPAGADTPEARARVEQFYIHIAVVFERWVARRTSPHTRRAYRQDVMVFVDFLEIRWPEDALRLSTGTEIRWPEDALRLSTGTVAEVLAFRDRMVAESKVPKTINRRIASLSSFYKYLQGVASEFRLPNSAHAQFIPRGSSDPRDETKALSATRARQLMGLPSGDTVFDYRDRAILKFFLYGVTGGKLRSGARELARSFPHRTEKDRIAASYSAETLGQGKGRCQGLSVWSG
jgi:site-specific recombinase XerD